MDKKKMPSRMGPIEHCLIFGLAQNIDYQQLWRTTKKRCIFCNKLRAQFSRQQYWEFLGVGSRRRFRKLNSVF